MRFDLILYDPRPAGTVQAIATITRPLYGFKRDLLTIFESLPGLHLA